ncbi:ATP-binding protein [Mesorhizobium sp. M0119]|uniref:hypothetical protein n=1 Tax=Mesorhizobium sp. M0119 TaxID=2956885 RepID=UPI0033386449
MLETFDLKQDPFPMVPNGPVHNWAGRGELKDELVDLVKGVRARDIGVTEFAIVYGEYGAGKSHALQFLKTYVATNDQFNSLAIYLERPRVASKINFLEIYKYIMRDIGKDAIRDCCKKLKTIYQSIVDQKVAGTGYQIKDQSSFHDPAMTEFAEPDRAMINLLLVGAEKFDAVYSYLTGEGKYDLEGLAPKIDSDFVAAKVLGQFFRVITADYKDKERIYESVYLFVDECEILIDVKASESELLFTGFRELINELPYRFSLLLSFSAATALIEAIMPIHLLKRMTRPYIEVGPLDDQHAREFIKSQMNFYRTENSPYVDTFYPFSNEAMDDIIGHMVDLTPRNIFIQCKRVLERSIRKYELKKGEEISAEMANRILENYR